MRLLFKAVSFILGLYIAGTIGVGLAFNPHIVRATFIRTIVSNNEHIFRDSLSFFVYEDRKIIKNFTQYSKRNFSAEKGLEAVVSTLRYLDTAFYSRCSGHSAYVPQRPSEIARLCLLKGVRGKCYNDAILLNFLLQVNGFKARNVSFEAKDGYGGSGHTVVEVWIPKLRKWVMVDAQNLAILYDGSGSPMGALDLKEALRKGASEIVAMQYGEGYLIPADQLVSYYRPRISTLVLIRRNDFETRYHRSPIVRAVSKLEGACGRLCVLVARFLYAITVGEERVVYGRGIGPYVSFTLWHTAFIFLLRLWLTLAALRLAGFLFGKMRDRGDG